MKAKRGGLTVEFESLGGLEGGKEGGGIVGRNISDKEATRSDCKLIGRLRVGHSRVSKC